MLHLSVMSYMKLNCALGLCTFHVTCTINKDTVRLVRCGIWISHLTHWNFIHKVPGAVQAVSRRLLTRKAWVCSRVILLGVRGGQIGTWIGFSSIIVIFYCQYHSTGDSYIRWDAVWLFMWDMCILTAVLLKIHVLWNVTICPAANSYRLLEGS
jgi:hypothetical protein